jgi:hypothetical protein
VYERRRRFGPDLERRDRHQQGRTRRAVGLALVRGRLTPVLAAVLFQLLDRCNDRLVGPAPEDGEACSGWWSLAYIHHLVYSAQGPEGVVVERERDDESGARTAGRWMAALRELGWVDVIHRYKIVNGEQRGTSNLWRLGIPDDLRHELEAAEDATRARKVARRPPSVKPSRGGPRPPYGPTRVDQARPVGPAYVSFADQQAARAAAGETVAGELTDEQRAQMMAAIAEAKRNFNSRRTGTVSDGP